MLSIFGSQAKMLDCGWIDVTKQRNDIETKPVSLCDTLGISTICNKVLALAFKIFKNLFTTQTKQRTNDAVVLGPHSCQTTQARTSQQVKQYGFCLVVTMMSNRYAGSFECFQFLTEPIVTKAASCHLDADALFLRILFRVEVSDRQRHIVLLAKPLDESLVSVRFFASQMEITMQSLHLVTKLLHNEQKRSGIGPAT